MPLYEYKCPDGHLTEVVVKYANRTDEALCATDGCENTAQWRPAVSAKEEPTSDAPNGVKMRNPERWSGFAWHEFVCTTCGNEMLEHLNIKEDPDALDKPIACARTWTLVDGEGALVLGDDDEPQLKRCDGQAHVRISFQVQTFFNRKFPTGYYDRGLGCYVRDEKHRREEMKKRNFVELKEGMDFSMDASLRAREDNHARIAREFEELEAKNQSSGVAQALSRAEETGELKDVMKKRQVRYHDHKAKPADAYWRRNQ